MLKFCDHQLLFGVQDFSSCLNLDPISGNFAHFFFKCVLFICSRSEHEMQQVDSVSQNNTVSTIFLCVSACVHSCVDICLYVGTHTNTNMVKV